jgi:hypothetical protein
VESCRQQKKEIKMPKVVYSASKGLYQESGSGFEIGDVAVAEASETMSAVADTAIESFGNTVIDSSLGAMPDLTLAVNTNVGATKFVTMSTYVGNATVTLSVHFVMSDGNSSAADTLIFSAVGQHAQLISDGTQWICVSTTAAEA